MVSPDDTIFSITKKLLTNFKVKKMEKFIGFNTENARPVRAGG